MPALRTRWAGQAVPGVQGGVGRGAGAPAAAPAAAQSSPCRRHGSGFRLIAAAGPKNPETASPLAVLCHVMCLKLQERDYDGAVFVAEKAAPYVHARLNAADVRVQHSMIDRSDDAIAQEIEALRLKKIEAAKTIDAQPVLQIDHPRNKEAIPIELPVSTE